RAGLLTRDSRPRFWSMPTKPSSRTKTKAETKTKTARPADATPSRNPGGAGVVLGLALTSKGATAATVECLLLPGRGKLILTGNLVGSARDAAQVAVSLARARAKKLGL